MLVKALLDTCPAIIGPSESGRLGIILRTKPAVRFGQRGIAAAALQVIDTDIPGEAGAHGEFALDAATRGHRRLIRKQHRAYLAILVRPAPGAQQGAVLSAAANILRRDKTVLPN